MTVQMAPNWANVKGIILSFQPSGEVENFMVVDIFVLHVNEVEGFPNIDILNINRGETLLVHIPEELFKKLRIKEFDFIKCKVRRAGLERYYVHRENILIKHINNDE